MKKPQRGIYLSFICILYVFVLTARDSEQGQQAREVIVVFKTHFDIGYTDWADNVRYNYAGSMVEGALEIIERSQEMPGHQQFNWIVAGWPMKEMLENSKPEVKPLIEQAIRNGNFTVHGLPFTFQVDACEPESMVRSLGYSSAINRQAGLPLPIDAKQTDVPSHSWVLPTILANAGIKFLHIGCNPASPSPDVPLLFWWEGPDKSRLMTMYFQPYYGTSPSPPHDWPFNTWLAIVHTNDNVGPPSYEEYVEAIREIEKKNPGARVRSGSMGDFYNALMAENPDLPVIRGDMPDTWIHGYMSTPRETKLARQLAKDIVNIENLNTLFGAWDITQDTGLHTRALEAMEKIHLFNEHTFGLAMSHGHGGYWAYGNDFEALRARGFYNPIEFSWAEKALHTKKAQQIIKPALARKVKKLALSIEAENEQIVVYNPLPWERSGIVTIQTRTNLGDMLRNTSTGELVRLSKDRNIYRFSANGIPPTGYATFVPAEDKAADKTLTHHYNQERFELENDFFRIKIDPADGTIRSIIDKKSGKEFVSSNSEWKFGQYVTERFSKENTDQYAHDYIKSSDHWHWAYPELGRINLTDEPYRRITGSDPEIIFVQDEVSVSANIHFEPREQHGHKYSMIITLFDNTPYIELIWSINGKPADPWPEAGWISFPFNINNPQFRLGRPGAIVDPATDFVKGTNLDYYFLNTGMAITGSDNGGFGITSPDVPGISLDRPGLWKYSTDFIPQKGNVFFNLYNNMWSTNFTYWVEGSWQAKFYLWSFDSYSNEQSVITPSEEFLNPLLAAYATGKPGNMPHTATGLILSRKGLQIGAFGPNPDGEGTLLRIWEQAGTGGEVTITFPAGSGYRTAQPVNLRGETISNPITVENQKLVYTINPHSPVSFIIK